MLPDLERLRVWAEGLDLSVFAKNSDKNKELLLSSLDSILSMIADVDESGAMAEMEHLMKKVDGYNGGDSKDDVILSELVSEKVFDNLASAYSSVANCLAVGKSDAGGGGAEPLLVESITSFEVIDKTPTSANVTWTTSSPASSSWVEYSGGGWGQGGTKDGTTYGTPSGMNWYAILTDLEPSALYNCEVHAIINGGNYERLGYFITQAFTVSGVSGMGESPTTAEVRWTSSHPATSTVYWGLPKPGSPPSNYDHTATGPNGTSHCVHITGLSTNQLYYYKVESRYS